VGCVTIDQTLTRHNRLLGLLIRMLQQTALLPSFLAARLKMTLAPADNSILICSKLNMIYDGLLILNIIIIDSIK